MLPIVKQISIHKSVIDFLRYIINADKTGNSTLVHGMNCAEDAYTAYKDFRRTYENCTGQKFENPSPDTLAGGERKKRKSRVLMHHYIQSFSPSENISPEQANEIGREWACRAFGKNYQVIVSTHVDKQHIHNHIAVCPYSLKGEKWNSNQKTLRKLRKLSDKIAKEHGVSVIENPQTKNHMKYKEWSERKSGTSWKENLCRKIDKFILDDDVNNVSDLADKLRSDGCGVRLGKYMTVKPPKFKRGIRTENLDKKYGGYSMREIEYRIEHKNKEISFEAISKMHGEQRAYAIYMRKMQIAVFQKQEHKHTYRDLVRSAELLTYMTEKSVNGLSDLERLADISRRAFYEILKSEKSVIRKIADFPEGDTQKRALLKSELDEIRKNKAQALGELRKSENMLDEYKRAFGLAEYEEAQREYEQLMELAEEETTDLEEGRSDESERRKNTAR